jgi:chitin-binding protein
VIVSEWTKSLNGQISGNNLNAGDKVIARFFDANGEVTSMRTEMTISSDAQGDANQWSYDLAQKINADHNDVRVGMKDEGGDVNPVHGANSVYVKDGSTLKSVAISYEEQQAQVSEHIALSNVQYSKVVNGNATVSFHVNTQGDVNFEAHVMNHQGAEKGYIKQDMNNANQDVTMNLTNVTAGHHMLKYYATNKAGTLFAQDVVDMMLEGDSASGDTGKYDFRFPDSLSSYTAGTVVLQPKDGKTYQCKPFPYSGYCVQYKKAANQYEPGVGSHWQQAWELKK